jgi:hypothetical protein
MNRRRFLIGAGAVGAVGALGWVGVSTLASSDRALDSDERPLALVYRGSASCSDCSEAVAALLQNSPARFRTEFCGPDEDREISRASLGEATVYAQPGGGNVESAWRRMRRYETDIREFVRGGGHYLGFCLGGYLAGGSPGFALLPGDTGRYIDTPGASVDDTEDTVIRVTWRGQPRTMYFQDGPLFQVRSGAPVTVLATYDTGAPAALIATFGAGRVGVVGPHPEADESWYESAGLTNPEGVRFDLGYDLVESTLRAQPSQ